MQPKDPIARARLMIELLRKMDDPRGEALESLLSFFEASEKITDRQVAELLDFTGTRVMLQELLNAGRGWRPKG